MHARAQEQSGRRVAQAVKMEVRQAGTREQPLTPILMLLANSNMHPLRLYASSRTGPDFTVLDSATWRNCRFANSIELTLCNDDPKDAAMRLASDEFSSEGSSV